MKIKRLAAAVAAVTIPVGASLVLTAVPALAIVGGCAADGNLCAEATHISGNVVTIRAYPPNTTIYGHFELQTPNHKTFNSITSIWHAGGTGNYFNNINGGVGNYVVTAWLQADDGSYAIVGQVNFHA